MEVILLERVAKLGQMGETIKVRDGFARNFLLPHAKALRANPTNKARFDAERSLLEARSLERKHEAQTVADALTDRSFVVVRSAGETGELYGSLAARDVAEVLSSEGVNVSRNQIELSAPIKTIGLHKVTIHLHSEVELQVVINIARSAEEAERQKKGESLTTAVATYGTDEDALQAAGVFDREDDFDGDNR